MKKGMIFTIFVAIFIISGCSVIRDYGAVQATNAAECGEIEVTCKCSASGQCVCPQVDTSTCAQTNVTATALRNSNPPPADPATTVTGAITDTNDIVHVANGKLRISKFVFPGTPPASATVMYHGNQWGQTLVVPTKAQKMNLVGDYYEMPIGQFKRIFSGHIKSEPQMDGDSYKLVKAYRFNLGVYHGPGSVDWAPGITGFESTSKFIHRYWAPGKSYDGSTSIWIPAEDLN